MVVTKINVTTKGLKMKDDATTRNAERGHYIAHVQAEGASWNSMTFLRKLTLATF